MAIVIEESAQKKGTAILIVALWILFLGGLAAGAYYVFVKQPDLIPVATPGEFKDTEQVSTIQLRPEDVLSNPQFKALKAHITVSPPGDMGRSNPFLAL